MRLRKLVNPRIQVRLTLSFMGLVLLALTFQFVLFTSVMSETLAKSPGAFAEQFAQIGGAFKRVLVISAAVILPLTALVGILTSFRIVGPLHAITNFLRRTQAGERPADCTLRSGDEYQDLCELVNQVTLPLRASPAKAPAPAAGGASRQEPSAPLPATDRSMAS